MEKKISRLRYAALEMTGDEKGEKKISRLRCAPLEMTEMKKPSEYVISTERSEWRNLDGVG